MKKKNLLIGLIVLAVIIGLKNWDVINFIKSIHPQKGDFIKVGKMSAPRYSHQTVLLDDGTVLINGGTKKEEPSEVYNPKTKQFTIVDYMLQRGFENAINLHNGKVLLIGGYGGYFPDNTQFYNISTRKFEIGPDLNVPRADAAATLLKDGRVLITGGGLRFANESEIYNPKTNKFELAPKMNIIRFKHSAILLDDGRVLIVGGVGIGPKFDLLPSAEIYDPKINKFKLVGNMNIARKNSNLYLLKNGNILITGGIGDDKGQGIWLREIELYNPNTNTFKIIAKRTSKADMPTEVLLRDDKILFTGGCTGVGLSLIYYKYSEIFDPQTNQFTKDKDMNFLRAGHEMTLLKDGNVLVSGSEGTNRMTELYINK